MDEIKRGMNIRDGDVYLTCHPNSAVADTEENQCQEFIATSGVMINVEEEMRESKIYDVYETLLVIVCLLLWTSLFNLTISEFSQTLLQPLRAMVDDMKAVASLELVHIDADDPKRERTEKVADEIKNLQIAFLHMRTSIRSWTRYVPPAVVQRLFAAGIEATIGVTKCTCSVLFCDIEDFEETCRGAAPERVLAMLGRVFTKIGEVVDADGGTLLEFIGDEVLAVYNAPSLIPNHTYRAVRSAVDINKSVASVHFNVGGPPVRCRCGVHTAEIYAGNTGASRRMKFGLLGDGVNLTARLKTLNSRYNTLTLASDTVMSDELSLRRFIFRPVDKVAVKGRAEPTTVYEILGFNKGQDSLLYKEAAQKHIEAFGLYLDRQFEKARVLFEEVKSVIAANGRDDQPSRQMMQRCTAYLRSPPPEDWDGIERLTTKTFVVQDEEEEEEEEVGMS